MKITQKGGLDSLKNDNDFIALQHMYRATRTAKIPIHYIRIFILLVLHRC